MKKLLIAILLLLTAVFVKAQTFPNVDSVKKFINDSVISNAALKASTLKKAYIATAKFLPDAVQDTSSVTSKAHGMIKFQRKDSTLYSWDTILVPKRWRRVINETLQQITNVSNTTTTDIFSQNSLDWYNVKQAGADATGSTDASTYIAAAIAAGKKYIYLPKGTYLLSSTVQLKDSVTIKGDGWSQTIIKLTSNITAFRCGYVSRGMNTQFLDFGIKGSGGSTAQQGIMIDSSSRVYVHNVAGYQLGGYAFRARLTAYGSYIPDAQRGNTISDCYVEGSYGGMMMDSASEYSTVTNCSFNANTYGIFNAGGNNRISNNNLSNNTYNFYLTGGFNNGHGVANGNTMNHGNYNVYIDGVTLGFSFVNNMIYSANIYQVSIRNSDRINFLGGDIIGSVPILDSNSTKVTFSNVNMRVTGGWTITGEAPVVMAIAGTGYTIWDVVNNKIFNFGFSNGQASIDTIPEVFNITNKQLVVYDSVTGNLNRITPGVFNYVAKTSTYTLTNYDHTVDCTSGSFTVTLPTAVGIKGKKFIIKNSGAGTITLATTSSQTIDGASPGTVAAGAVVQLQSTDANWIKIN